MANYQVDKSGHYLINKYGQYLNPNKYQIIKGKYLNSNKYQII